MQKHFYKLCRFQEGDLAGYLPQCAGAPHRDDRRARLQTGPGLQRSRRKSEASRDGCDLQEGGDDFNEQAVLFLSRFFCMQI